MAVKVKGNDVIVWIQDSVVKPVACSTSCTLEVNAETIETLTVNSGYWKDPAYQSLEWSVTVENVIILDDADSKINSFYLLQAQINFLTLMLQFTMTDGTNDRTVSGFVIVPSNVFTGGVDDFARHTVVFKGKGPLVIHAVEIGVPEITIEVTGDGTGAIQSIILRKSDLTQEWTLTGPFNVGSTNTWLLNGSAGNPPAGEYYMEAVLSAADDNEGTFSTDAPPTVSIDISAPGAILDSAPFGNSVLYDFTENRTITFEVNAIVPPGPAAITINVTGTGTGSSPGSIVLYNPTNGLSYTMAVPPTPGTTIVWPLDGTIGNPFGNPAPDSYQIWGSFYSDEAGNTFSTDAPPTIAGDSFGSGFTALNTLPSAGATLFDFTTSRTITFEMDTPVPGPEITINVTGTGTGGVFGVDIYLKDSTTGTNFYLANFPATPGTTVTWPLDGVGGNPPPGTYEIHGSFDSNEADNTFSTNAPPTVAGDSFAAGVTDLYLLPSVNNVDFDFTASRIITINMGS